MTRVGGSQTFFLLIITEDFITLNTLISLNLKKGLLRSVLQAFCKVAFSSFHEFPYPKAQEQAKRIRAKSVMVSAFVCFSFLLLCALLASDQHSCAASS